MSTSPYYTRTIDRTPDAAERLALHLANRISGARHSRDYVVKEVARRRSLASAYADEGRTDKQREMNAWADKGTVTVKRWDKVIAGYEAEQAVFENLHNGVAKSV
jgi:hypothetical protein